MKNCNTETYCFTRSMADLYINLFNGDGGDGYDDEEINHANIFIKKRKIQNLIEVKDLPDYQVKCTFSVNRTVKQSYPVWFLWKIDTPYIWLYEDYGFLPYPGGIINSKVERIDFPSRKAVKEYQAVFIHRYYPTESRIVIADLYKKLDAFWAKLPQQIKRSISVLPSTNDFWSQLEWEDKINIYNYCIIVDNDLPFSEPARYSLLNEIGCKLALMAMCYIYQRPADSFSNKQGCYLKKYQTKFDKLYDDIQASIMAAVSSKEKQGILNIHTAVKASKPKDN